MKEHVDALSVYIALMTFLLFYMANKVDIVPYLTQCAFVSNFLSIIY